MQSIEERRGVGAWSHCERWPAGEVFAAVPEPGSPSFRAGCPATRGIRTSGDLESLTRRHL
jgi:hypothetical protein